MAGEFAVIGLGQFGRSVATHLVREGNAVLAIDRNPERAQMVSDEVDAVMVADATVEAALAELGLDRMTCVVVAMGITAKETSIMVTALLRQRGVPKIVSRAFDELHGRVLLAVGAHEIVSPEHDMGERLARHLSQPNVEDEIVLGTHNMLAAVHTPHALVGLAADAHEVVPRFNVRVLAVVRNGAVVTEDLAGLRMQAGDRLVILGDAHAVRRFAALV
jgi:trk system potassium uptake protein